MSARDCLDQGQLTEAIRQLNDEVRQRPTDLELRTFLFQLHAYAGDLTRASKQLEVIRTQTQEAEYLNGLRVYQGLLDAEQLRRNLFDKGVRPRFMMAPPDEVVAYLDALDLARGGDFTSAKARLDQAASTLQAARGHLDGTTFDDFRDADDVLAPVLEVFTATGYYWVPWVHVQFLEVPAPKTLLDLLWTPAKLATFDGQLGEVYLPTLYPRSSDSTDDLIRLGRQTDWIEQDAGIVRGLGRKSFLVGEELRTLHELSQVQFICDVEHATETALESTEHTGDPS